MSQSTAASRRVVITGVGVLSPQGIGRAALESSLAEGRSGIARAEHYEASLAPGRIVGEIRDFTEETAKKLYLKAHRKHLKVMGRDVMLGVAAAVLGIEDARLDASQLDRERIGVEFGANLMFSTPQYLAGPGVACTEGKQPPFLMERWGEQGFGNMEPLWMLKYLPNMPACHVAIFTDSRGPNNSITQDEVSSNLAIGEASAVIRRGHADVMITGSTGLKLHAIKEMHAVMWDRLGYDSEHPERSVKPFDLHRSGHAISEAAACLILEEEASARARGASVLGRVLGSGSSCVMTPAGEPDVRKAIANALRAALRMSGLAPEQIGHINAHGLAHPELDALEAAAIRDVFGAATEDVPVVGLKGYHGNPGASGGMLEVALSVLSLQQGLIPHTLNTEQVDPALGLQVLIGQPRATENRTFAKISYTFAGQASVVIVEC